MRPRVIDGSVHAQTMCALALAHARTYVAYAFAAGECNKVLTRAHRCR